MTIAPAPQPRDLEAEQLRDIERFEQAISQYLAGEIPEDVFRVMRLNNGIYGQRQGGTNQMVRIKVPAGSITADQLDLFGDISTEFSRGWGHITTRQNVQFHFVELRRIPDLLRRVAAVGLTSREACGDTVRNVMACHLAGVTTAVATCGTSFGVDHIKVLRPMLGDVSGADPNANGEVVFTFDRAQPDRPD